jgi:integrase/recombinase XerD
MADTILHQIIKGSRKITEKTRAAYLEDIDRWVAFAGTDPRGWTPQRAQEFYNELLTHMRPQSAKRAMAPISYASAWWAKKERNPLLHFTVIQQEPDDDPAERHALSPEEAGQLLATCSSGSPIDLRDRAMFVVGLETGMRRMSLAGMALEKITKSTEGYPIAAVPIKGSRDKLYPVPLSDAAVAALAPWRKWLKGQQVTTGAVFRGLTKRMMPKTGKIGYEISDSLSLISIYKIVIRRAATAGLQHVHPHIFRHTFMTWRTEAGLTPIQIASITGHKITGLPGMAVMGMYIDPGRLGDEARASTPAWLTKLLKGT